MKQSNAKKSFQATAFTNAAASSPASPGKADAGAPGVDVSKADVTHSFVLDDIPITEGFVPFGAFRTYFRIAGSISSSKPPLLLLHGGPGSTHNYFELLDHLANDTGRAIISYDQLGCGESYLENRPELWVAETWVNELANLIGALGLKRIHLLGQSWGGMLAITYLADRTQTGICSVILSSTLCDSQLWGKEQHRMVLQLPQEEQDAIAQAEITGNDTAEAYQSALAHYMQIHCSNHTYGEGAPECLVRERRSGNESYCVAWGPNELTPAGTLAGWNYTDRLHEITVPAFIISGTEDLCTPLIAKTMYDNLPNAKWELMPGCRHMCFVDGHETYCKNLAEWMAAHDGETR